MPPRHQDLEDRRDDDGQIEPVPCQMDGIPVEISRVWHGLALFDDDDDVDDDDDDEEEEEEDDDDDGHVGKIHSEIFMFERYPYMWK